MSGRTRRDTDMRLTPFLLACLPGLAQAETDLSALIAAEGLRGAEATLAALALPSPSERFALGGVRFLAGIETALQTRWKVGLTEGLTTFISLPILRLPIPENPTPAPFSGAVIGDLFSQVGTDMAGAIALLDGLGPDEAVAVRLNTADIWFDINSNGGRDGGEGLAEVAGWGLTAGFGEPLPAVSIRFDTADAAWLAAYAHLLAGLSDAVLALDPVPAIDAVLAGRDAIGDLNAQAGAPFGSGLGYQIGDYADLAAILVDVIEGPVDATRAQSAQGHLLAMVAQNRNFWTWVAAETDNEAEWIPNKRQVSALGLPFPPDTGQLWLAVLTDAERLLTGDLLIPHWRLAEGAGIDLNALLQDPPEIDILGMAHGMDLMPYARLGPRMAGDALWRFEQMLGGQAGLYMVILN